MSKQVSRKGDYCTGHGGYPPRQSLEGSNNVFINSIPANRQDDLWAVHCNDDDCHNAVSIVSSTSVFVNSKSTQKVGDFISCGSKILEGSLNVFSG